MFNPFANLQYLTHRMPIPGGLSSSTYPLAPWPYNPLPNVYKSPTYNPGDLSDLSGLVNGLADRNSFDPLENFNPHDNDDPIPLEKNGSDIALDVKSPVSTSSEYSLFPDAEPLCSPKASHSIVVGDRDELSFSRSVSQEHERDQRSYATALKDHKDGQQIGCWWKHNWMSGNGHLVTPYDHSVNC
jgi:hypothetical protein